MKQNIFLCFYNFRRDPAEFFCDPVPARDPHFGKRCAGYYITIFLASKYLISIINTVIEPWSDLGNFKWVPCIHFVLSGVGWTYTKIGTIQRRLAWPLRKDDTQNREAFQIFYFFWFRTCSSNFNVSEPQTLICQFGRESQLIQLYDSWLIAYCMR